MQNCCTASTLCNRFIFSDIIDKSTYIRLTLTNHIYLFKHYSSFGLVDKNVCACDWFLGHFPDRVQS